MRFWTIWTTPALSLMERIHRTRDWGFAEVALKLPVRLKYFVTLQQIGKATRTSKDIPATSLSDILRNLEAPKDLS